MKVTISNTGHGHITVHRPGCRDLARERYVSRWDADVQTQREAVMDTYPPDEFDYDPEEQWESYDDLQFKPCVRLPRA